MAIRQHLLVRTSFTSTGYVCETVPGVFASPDLLARDCEGPKLARTFDLHTTYQTTTGRARAVPPAARPRTRRTRRLGHRTARGRPASHDPAPSSESPRGPPSSAASRVGDSSQRNTEYCSGSPKPHIFLYVRRSRLSSATS